MKRRWKARAALFFFAAIATAACGGESGTTGGGGSGGSSTTSSGGGGAGGTTSTIGEGGTTTTDPFLIDECDMGIAECDPNASCINTLDYYECICAPGYEGDGKTCEDIDECATLVADCDPNATCTNSPGAFACACPDGFVGDGKTCDATYTGVAAGQYHACGLRSDHTLWCWGLNTSGQVGTGTGDAFFVKPAQAGGATDWASVSAGTVSTCALSQAGKLSCWGSNGFGQLGDGTLTARSSPNPVGGGFTDWIAFDAGSFHTCGIREGGALYCWGRNNAGQVGDGTTADKKDPTLVSAGPWTSVSAGAEFTCAIKGDKTLWCWGTGTSRQLGNGLATNSAVPVQEKGLANDWANVTAGNAFACAVKENGTRYCWGLNALGQGGDTTVTTITEPKQADAETDWKRADAGDVAVCGLRGAGTLHCWGDGSQGQTGQPGNEAPLLAPAQVGAESDWIAVASGLRFACGVRATGQLFCWGTASRGALGAGYTADRTAPEVIGAETAWARVAVQMDDGCAIREDGSLWCWGRNVFEHLGDGTNVTRVAPVQVGAGKTWARVALGRTHTCGIADEGGQNGLYCWGRDANGELGDGAVVTNQTTPAPITPPAGAPSTWTELDAGFNHTCAARADKTLWCWGVNTRGQLGDGTKVARPSATQVLPADTHDWTTVAAAGEFSCGLRTGGALWCWGRNDVAQLGLGFASPAADISVPNPTKVGNASYSAIDAGANHACAVKTDGTLWCWGRNASSELGLGNAVGPVLSPTQVGAANDWAQPHLGQGLHTCATKTNGDMYCWGLGSYGQLGLGNLTSFNSPQKVPSVAAWKMGAIGNEHTCGVRATGELACWGASNFAQLGSGSPFASSPVLVVNP